MGDLKGLMDKIHSAMDEKELMRQQKKLESGKFTLRDLVTQMEGMEKIGGFDKELTPKKGDSRKFLRIMTAAADKGTDYLLDQFEGFIKAHGC